ncbi:OLC1v1029067C1 [Oldenlandia corymbosa var. corymbosa]|uniref:OLC1v1029067C1 n=1 Tax=Oldenlandia corymbosa var. corymbosa TaxID=529605 RepID=A0AAV1CDX7_OLDCO|nr:OLC1v1029067C1 [Oldenlandia corymbosa var. corymbosa]
MAPPAMIRCLVSLLFFLMAVMAEGKPLTSTKPPQLCPDSCPEYCTVDCTTCKPICIAKPPPPLPNQKKSPPPPPKKPKKSPPPPPKGPKRSPPPPPKKPKRSPPPPPMPKHLPPPPSSILFPPPSSTPPPPTPTSNPPPSPPPLVSGKTVYCKNKDPLFSNAIARSSVAQVLVQIPVRPGAVCQDPRFVGADGLTFYFHGKKDRDFCIVSDSNLHINAHFIGKRNGNMTTDFTWVQSLDNNLAIIEVEGNFQIKATVVPITEKESRIHQYGITDEDCFAHLDMSFKFYSLSGAVNGVLGQTYANNYVSRVKMGVNMPVLGGNKEFASSNIFSTDCAVARFMGTSSASADNFEYENLNCASRLDGSGVVCKK